MGNPSFISSLDMIIFTSPSCENAQVSTYSTLKLKSISATYLKIKIVQYLLMWLFVWKSTGNNVSDRVLVSCPVLPGTVYYGKLPPSPAAPIAVDDVTVSAAGASNEPSPAYCVRLISSVDDVASGREGLSDRMKYTVSECIDPTSLTGISSQPMNSQVTNEGQHINNIYVTFISRNLSSSLSHRNWFLSIDFQVITNVVVVDYKTFSEKMFE